MESIMQNQNSKKRECPCTYPGCPRHGDCEACKAYHHGMGQKTSCERMGKE